MTLLGRRTSQASADAAIGYLLLSRRGTPLSPPSQAMTSVPGRAWAAAVCAIGGLLATDLLASRRRAGISRAVLLSAAWVGAGIAFGLVLTLCQGGDAGQQYFGPTSSRRH